MKLLDLKYKYNDDEYICSCFKDSKKREIVRLALIKINQDGILNKKTHSSETPPGFPVSFYLHLTYRCNLSCTYCYNKRIRKDNQTELPIESWITIINKIAPYAKSIILTGGEFLLYHDIETLVAYIHERIPRAIISGISNGMRNYREGKYKNTLSYLSDLTLSCDSLNSIGERKGFSPNRFVANIKYLREHFPELNLIVSRTSTAFNVSQNEDFLHQCESLGCKPNSAILCPSESSEIDLMPPIDGICQSYEQSSSNEKFDSLPRQNKCGAAYAICSIDPSGEVYPCQSLHFPEFNMGNILHMEIGQLRYIDRKEELMPDINTLETCGKCQVRYLCGGGCLANSYRVNNNHFGRNRLLCPAFYTQSISRLKRMLENISVV